MPIQGELSHQLQLVAQKIFKSIQLKVEKVIIFLKQLNFIFLFGTMFWLSEKYR